MQALGKIRSDLRAIRYYYARKPFFDSAGYVTGTHEVVGLAARYNEVMRSASPQLYDLYVGLYVRNSTQEAFSRREVTRRTISSVRTRGCCNFCRQRYEEGV